MSERPESSASDSVAAERSPWNFAGKVAVITGGANGIGRAVATMFAAAAAKVAILDRADGGDAASAIRSSGGVAEAIACDLAESVQIESAIAKTAETLGPVDMLIHCAGLYPPQSFSEMNSADWRRLMAVNLDSAYHLCQAVLPGMVEREWGRVIFTASTTIYSGHPLMAHYVASKAALVGLTRSLARGYGKHGITVNAVAPGAIRTPLGQIAHEQLGGPGFYEDLLQRQSLKRVGRPEDIAGAMAFLASSSAEFITGQTLCVDGGAIFK